MMSYTMSWTDLWSNASTLMRRTSPCTRIIGGSPADRCRSEALFLTEKASSCVMSIGACERARLEGNPRDKLRGIMGSIGSNLQEVQRRIATTCEHAGRDANEVTLLAVSKTFDVDAVR